MLIVFCMMLNLCLNVLVNFDLLLVAMLDMIAYYLQLILTQKVLPLILEVGFFRG